MSNRLEELAKKEQELVAALRDAEEESSELFATLRSIMKDREYGMSELIATQQEINLLIKKGEEEILADIRSGKVGLVDAETGEPKTVALFQKR